jgi:hypothetical protein
MITITQDKDDFTGLRTIRTNFFGLNDFITFSGPTEIYIDFLTKQNNGIKSNVIDAIDLLYIEHESGQGSIVLRVVSAMGKYLRNAEWPNWDNSWPFIIDGERVSLSSTSTNKFESSYELKIYDLPIDIFNKICHSNEVRYSLRGRNTKIEGLFKDEQLKVFKAFEQYCFADENEGKRIIEELNRDYLKTSNTKSLKKEDQESKLSKEEIDEIEQKIVDFLKEKRINDAVRYYSAKVSCDETVAKDKVIEIAKKNGLYRIILKQIKIKQVLWLLFYIPFLGLIFYLGTLNPNSAFANGILFPLLVLLFGILIIRSIVILFRS